MINKEFLNAQLSFRERSFDGIVLGRRLNILLAPTDIEGNRQIITILDPAVSKIEAGALINDFLGRPEVTPGMPSPEHSKII